MKDATRFDYKNFKSGFILGVILGIIPLLILWLVPKMLIFFLFLYLLLLIIVAFLNFKKNKTESDSNLAGFLIGIAFDGILLYLFQLFYTNYIFHGAIWPLY